MDGFESLNHPKLPLPEVSQTATSKQPIFSLSANCLPLHLQFLKNSFVGMLLARKMDYPA